jgi:hypothetical protein
MTPAATLTKRSKPEVSFNLRYRTDRVSSEPLGISAGPGMTSAVVVSAAGLKAHCAATRHSR